MIKNRDIRFIFYFHIDDVIETILGIMYKKQSATGLDPGSIKGDQTRSNASKNYFLAFNIFKIEARL